MAAFLDWVGANRNDPRRAARSIECYGDGDRDAGWCEGFCNGFAGTAGTTTCTVRFWKADPRAARFDALSVPGPLDCSDLGETNDRVQAGPDVGCSLRSPAGMRATINRRDKMHPSIFVVTAEYLGRDRAFASVAPPTIPVK